MNYDENEGREPLTTPDTENSTKFNANEADDPEKFDKLSGINTGVVDSFGNADNSAVSRQDRASAFDIISDKANLPEFLRREGRNLIMDEVDTKKLSRPGTSVHIIAFCLAVCLVNERCDRRNYHPQGKDNDVYLAETRKEFGFDTKLIHSYLQKLRNEVKEL